jgi:hypothetical protein
MYPTNKILSLKVGINPLITDIISAFTQDLISDNLVPNKRLCEDFSGNINRGAFCI